jgi:hypothetical protein
MNFWFGLLLLVFLLVTLLVWLQISLLSPEVWLLLLSSLALGLFAFRLLSTYVLVITTADFYQERGEIKDIFSLSKKSGKSEEEIQKIPLSVILALILEGLAPFRYAFYLAFMLLLLLSLAVGFLPPGVPLREYIEALFWGAAITAFITWGFENFAETAVAQLAEMESSQGENSQNQQQSQG